MTPAFSDPALFFKVICGHVEGRIRSFVDDTTYAGKDDFQESSKPTPLTFESKQREYNSFKFSAMEIESLPENSFRIQQQEFAKRLKNLDKNYTFSESCSTREKLSRLVPHPLKIFLKTLQVLTC